MYTWFNLVKHGEFLKKKKKTSPLNREPRYTSERLEIDVVLRLSVEYREVLINQAPVRGSNTNISIPISVSGNFSNMWILLSWSRDQLISQFSIESDRDKNFFVSKNLGSRSSENPNRCSYNQSAEDPRILKREISVKMVKKIISSPRMCGRSSVPWARQAVLYF